MFRMRPEAGAALAKHKSIERAPRCSPPAAARWVIVDHARLPLMLAPSVYMQLTSVANARKGLQGLGFKK